MDEKDLKQSALDYHQFPLPGKLATKIIKPMDSQQDLALAYTPGVAKPVLEIFNDSEKAYQYTSKGNLVGVISNGSATLGMGNVGALACKPVMEGKAVLFKRFADIDVFDIEIDAEDPQVIISTVKSIAPTFGGINLEDIKAPECFEIEQSLMDQLNIPVFHDDQHGTAIVVAAGLLNALEIQGKRLSEVKIVCIGAGAAGIASMKLLLALGANKQQMWLLDSKGVIHTGRNDLNAYKFGFAHTTAYRTLKDVLQDADVFLGVAGADLLTPDLLMSMAAKPVIFALSNPNPEIIPEVAHKVRNDIIIATGRSDYPNQVNNVLCFPYIFRGALDVRARCINQSMQIAAVEAIRQLAHEPVPQTVKDSYKSMKSWQFGVEYIIPKPLDPRLKESVSKAVSQAAIESKVSQLVNETIEK